MMHSLTFFRSLTLIVWSTVLLQDAAAYLDPGTGSFILQIVVASFLGALLTVKTWWYRLKNLFKKSAESEASEVNEPDDTN